MAGKLADGLLEMILFIELYTPNRAWSELTDRELFWDPMPVLGLCNHETSARRQHLSLLGRGRLTSIAWLCWQLGSQPARTAELDFFGRHTDGREWNGRRPTSQLTRFSRPPERRSARCKPVGALSMPLCGPQRTNSLSDRHDSGATADNLDRWNGRPGDQLGVERGEAPRDPDRSSADLYRLRASVSIERYA